MQIETLLESFFRDVPEMREMFEIMCNVNQIQMLDGEYIVWDYGIMPCIAFLANNVDQFRDVAERVFRFIEKAVTSDQETRVFLEVSMMYCVYYDMEEETQKRVCELMGTETKRLWKDYCRLVKNEKLAQLSALYSDEEMDSMGMDYIYV